MARTSASCCAARELLGGRGAVRVHGGGFAGTAEAWVPLDMLEGFLSGLSARGFDAFRVEVRPAGAVRLV